MRYPVVIYKDQDSDFGVMVPDISGCYSAGSSYDEALNNAIEAIECHLEGLLLDNETLPVGTSIENWINHQDFQDGIWAFVDIDLSQISERSKRVDIKLPVKMHLIEKVAMITWHGVHYAVPIDVIDKYKLPQGKEDCLSIDDVFGDLISEYGESGSLLKGLRGREGLSQIEFAKKINITQTNLSAIENGRRSIGKELAKRISAVFNIDYRLLL